MVENNKMNVNQVDSNWLTANTGLMKLQKIYSQTPSLYKRLVFLALGLLAFTGLIDQLLYVLGWNNIFLATEKILNASMKSAAANTLILALIKGSLAFMSSLEGSVVLVSANIGAFFSGFSDLVDMAFNFFLSISGLIVSIIAFIKVIELTGISIFAGAAFILFAIDPSLKSNLGKIGKLLVTIGLVMFFLFPISIASIGKAYETHRIQTEIQYTENIGVLAERSAEITIRSLGNEEGRSNALGVIKDGSRTLWDGFMNLVVSYILMFVLLPLISLGLCFLIIKKILSDQGYQAANDTLSNKASGITDFMLSKQKAVIAKE